MPDPADPLALEALALRYAAGRLTPAAAAAFEERLADDQAARDALAEAVQLSAAALGQESPAPDRSFRRLIRERLRGAGWLRRRAYRGHPFTWAAVGAVAVAAATVAGLWLADAPNTVSAGGVETAAVVPAVVPAPPPPAEAVAVAPPDLRAAEIWAELSTPDHAEKTHGDDARFRQWLNGLNAVPPGRSAARVDDL